MFDRTVQLDVACTQDQAFTHIAREFFENKPKWDTDIVELSQTSSGQIAVGSTGREVRNVNGRRFVTEFRISDFTPEERFGHRATAGAMTENVDYQIKALATGATVTLQVVIKPATILMKLLSPVIRPQVERNFAVNVARFERMLNALPGPPASAP